MTKKKKVLLVLTILAVILLAFIGGQAYAKYVSEVRGEGVAEVATWNFKVNGQSEQVEEIKLASTCNNETLVDNKIAPGTSGSFDIIVDATGSEVGINYNITFTEEENKPQNLKFTYDDVEYNSIEELESKIFEYYIAEDFYRAISRGMVSENEMKKFRDFRDLVMTLSSEANDNTSPIKKFLKEFSELEESFKQNIFKFTQNLLYLIT